MKNIKWISLILILVLLLSTTPLYAVSTNNEYTIDEETEKMIIDYVAEHIIDEYEKYYTINEILGKINNAKIEDNFLEAEVNMSFSKVLLAESAYELPYIKGMLKKLDTIEDKNEKIVAEKYIKNRIKDLNDNYIGTEQKENANFIIRIPLSSKSLPKQNYLKCLWNYFLKMNLKF